MFEVQKTDCDNLFFGSFLVCKEATIPEKLIAVSSSWL